MSSLDSALWRPMVRVESPDPDAMDGSPDHVLNKFSPKNPYILSIFISASTVWFFSGLTMMVSAFAVAEMCAKGAVNCTTDENTINAEFGLTDGRESLASLSTSAYLFGNMLGASTVARFTDIRGRRLPMALSLVAMGALGCAAASAGSIWLFIVLRFLQGIFFPGCGIPGWNIAYESSPKRLRNYTTLVFGTMWVGGYCAVAPIAYFLPYWRHMMIACSAPALIFGLIFLQTIPESFHFMISRGMEKGVEEWLSKANAVSRRPVDVNVKALIACHERRAKADDTHGTNIFLQVIRHKRLLFYMGIMVMLWVSDTLIYYGLSFFSTQLAGNKYVNYVLSGLVEAPSNLVSPWLLDVLGRRAFISGAHILAAFAFLCSLFFEHPTAALIFWLIGKFGIICSFNCLYVYCSELFPTPVRSGCTGACEAVGRLAGTFAPGLGALKSIHAALPRILFTVVAALSGTITLLLPETRDRVLPDSAAELA